MNKADRFHVVTVSCVLLLALVVPLLADLPQLEIVGGPVKSSDEFVAVRDANGRFCAAIQVISDFDDLSYDSYNGVIDVDRKPGQDMVYLQPDERVLEIFKLGFEKMKIILSEIGISLSGKEVWKIEISGDKEFALPEGKGGFHLESIPSGAVVEVDGLADIVKRTPCDFEDMYALPYRVTLTRQRYLPVDTIITIKKDKIISLNIRLDPTFGNLQLFSDPKGEVLINGKVYGNTPLTLAGEGAGLDSGSYSITIRKDDEHAHSYVPFNKRVLIRPGETVRISEKLKEKKGVLSVKSNADNANYKVTDLENNRIIFEGVGNLNEEVLTGRYKVDARATGYTVISRTVEVSENEKESVNFEFTEKERMAYIEQKEKERKEFSESLYTQNSKSNFVLTEGFIISRQLIYYFNNLVALGVPILGGGLMFAGDPRHGYRSVSTYGAGFVLGNGIISENSIIIDFLSVGVGIFIRSRDSKTRFMMDVNAALMFEFPFKNSFDYNGEEIVRENKDFWTYNSDRKKVFSPMIIPFDAKISFERHLSGKAFFILRSGLYFAPEQDWFRKTDIELWKESGGDKPLPLVGSDLPDSPYTEGFVLYFAVGIRWFILK